MKKTYLFDFDGTLVDSMPTFVSVMLRILDEHNTKYGDDIVKIITPLGYHGAAEYFRSLGLPKSADEIVRLMNSYAQSEYENNIEAKTGVIDTLRTLHESGSSLNVLTASPHIMLDPCLKRLGIFELFDNVWSCDDFQTTKANPEIYRMAANRLGCKADEVIFIDDNVNAVKTARLAGMRAFGVYDDSSKDLVDEMKIASDRYLYTLCELTKK